MNLLSNIYFLLQVIWIARNGPNSKHSAVCNLDLYPRSPRSPKALAARSYSKANMLLLMEFCKYGHQLGKKKLEKGLSEFSS